MTRPLPLLVSVPHGGLGVPERLRDRCLLSEEQIVRDGDEGAAVIYAFEDRVRHRVATDVARCVIDMNRAEDDVRKDGVVKTHTCWDEPVWRTPLTRDDVRWLLDTVHRPYHARLSALAHQGVVLGIDAHTMAAEGPPVGPDPGRRRPPACLGIGDGTCPRPWADTLARALAAELGGEVTLNDPFAAGFITRSHAREIPWVQLELSRTTDPPPEEKRARVLAALERLCRDQGLGE